MDKHINVIYKIRVTQKQNFKQHWYFDFISKNKVKISLFEILSLDLILMLSFQDDSPFWNLFCFTDWCSTILLRGSSRTSFETCSMILFKGRTKTLVTPAIEHEKLCVFTCVAEKSAGKSTLFSESRLLNPSPENCWKDKVDGPFMISMI